ncbi:MAG TPA: hypothetical protein VF503_13050 [Sphingobium sp.]|uniref:hypothetical protein n=1 Tax=Sphingobium sp. TaxID=1912891 RepID=UPI002ECFB766
MKDQIHQSYSVPGTEMTGILGLRCNQLRQGVDRFLQVIAGGQSPINFNYYAFHHNDDPMNLPQISGHCGRIAYTFDQIMEGMQGYFLFGVRATALSPLSSIFRVF